MSKIELGENAKLILFQNTFINSGCYLTAGKNAVIEIGENTYFAHEVVINTKSQIRIGKNCLISFQVVMMDYDGHMIYEKTNHENREYINSGKTAPIVIGDHVWIGYRSKIMKGITIGNGAIIAAGSTVTSDVPENCLVAGCPAKVIKTNIDWER